MFNIIISIVSALIVSLIIGFVIKPLVSFKKVIKFIDRDLKFYKDTIVSGDGLEKDIIYKASRDIRKLSCDIESSYKQILFKQLFIKLKILPKTNHISEVSRSLISISNACAKNIFIDKNLEAMNKIRLILNIKEL